MPEPLADRGVAFGAVAIGEQQARATPVRRASRRCDRRGARPGSTTSAMVSGFVKPEFRSRSFSTCPRSSARANGTSISVAHDGTRAALFVDRNAFGQPARDALLRHLQRDDVRELVPQRRLPGEVARRLGARRVHADDAAEARAERADQAGQAEVADREVVVDRKDLDEDRPLRRELVGRGQLLERLVRQRDGVLAKDLRLVRDRT